jgi:FkbM family methyltransferase
MRKMPVKALKNFLPNRIYNSLRRFAIARQNRRHMRGIHTTQLKIAGIDVDIPSNHILIGTLPTQPRRDLALADAAELVGEKYPDREIVDVGANVGDTACIIASKCKSKLVLVEGSDFYFPYLQVNAKKISNVTSLYHCLVGDGASHGGMLAPWGGTAHFVDDAESRPNPTKTLAELSSNFCMIKVDTDGWDFKILSSNMRTIDKLKPLIVFENQIRTDADLASCSRLYDELFASGYAGYCLFDEQGYHVISTSCRSHLDQLNRLMYLQYKEGAKKAAFWNLDVYCFHENDSDLYHNFKRRFE